MKKILFLDRDGVINKDEGYTYKVSDLSFIEGIFDLCKKYIAKGYEIIIITNQAGIAKGYFTENDYTIFTNHIVDTFKSKDIPILNIYHCPHHPNFTGGCKCRKPNIGMFENAKKDYNIDFKNSIMVGDKISDLIPANKMGIKNLFLLNTEKNNLDTNFKYKTIKYLNLI